MSMSKVPESDTCEICGCDLTPDEQVVCFVCYEPDGDGAEYLTGAELARLAKRAREELE